MSFAFYLIAALTVAGGLAAVLLKAIAFATNLFYYQRLGSALVSPAGVPVSSVGRAVRGVCADSGLHWRGGHFGGVCDSFDAGF